MEIRLKWLISYFLSVSDNVSPLDTNALFSLYNDLGDVSDCLFVSEYSV